MNLINDGELLAGSTWVVGYKPTDEDSVKIKGGLWLNEVGMEDTKEETTMIDLSGCKLGDELLTEYEFVVVVIAISEASRTEVCCRFPDGGIALFDIDGKRSDHAKDPIISKHEPRHWLKDLPDADLFCTDINYIFATSDGYWFCYTKLDETHWCSHHLKVQVE